MHGLLSGRDWEGASARLRARLGQTFLRAAGWSLAGPPPNARRYVLVAAPHTSNWDLPLMLAVASALGVRVHWMGKEEIFHFPVGVLMRQLGGLPIERDKHTGVVEAMAARYAQSEDLVIAIPPEGTRGAVPYWRSGFYWIAQAARVPVALGYLDYARRVGGIGPLLRPSGDLRADMDKIRAFYADKQGKYPQNFATPRLTDEQVSQVMA